jgi:cell division initiation protein
MAEITGAQSVRDARFREKVRGYHPGDVDEFVAKVATAMEELQRKVEAAEARAAELEGRADESSEIEDSLRRTLVLAQRTADLAIQEAREEAARLLSEATEKRDRLVAEVEELRSRLTSEAEEEVRGHREQLHSERDALRADVDALDTHLARERERLKIYFADQLRRVEAGEPGLPMAPPMQAPPRAEPAAEQAEAETEPETEPEAADGGDGAPEEDGDGRQVDDDPFLAELRRAVNDEAPLGPRDDPLPADGVDDGFDLFAQGDDDPGRFGSRLRRRR